MYAPGDDYKWALSVTSYYRQCSPMAEDITNLVTFHLFFDKDHPPNTGVMSNEDLEHFKVPKFGTHCVCTSGMNRENSSLVDKLHRL